jgi:response regulator RpfG family c-di-GMP phosphodiesterase
VDIVTGDSLKGFKQSDGSASGKRGEEIPIYGRIVALADVYDALSSARVYKEAWDEAEVLSKIEENSGRHFDPELVEIFFDSLDLFRSIQKRYTDEE